MADVQSSKGHRRREAIMKLLKQQGRITIQEVVERFGCSEATARRDLEQMESQISGHPDDWRSDVRWDECRCGSFLSRKQDLSFLEKERIAKAAAA